MYIPFMQRATRFIYVLLKNTFLITVIGWFVAWIGDRDILLVSLFGMVGFLGTMLTFYLFILHVVLVVLTLIFKNRDSGV